MIFHRLWHLSLLMLTHLRLRALHYLLIFFRSQLQFCWWKNIHMLKYNLSLFCTKLNVPWKCLSKKKKKNQYWICRGMKFTVNTWSSKLNMLFFLQCNYLSVGDLMLNGIFSPNLACKAVFTLRTWPAPNKLWVRWSVLGRVTADRTIRTLPPRKEIITISLVWSHTPASTSNSIPAWWSLTHRKSSLVTNWKNRASGAPVFPLQWPMSQTC